MQTKVIWKRKQPSEGKEIRAMKYFEANARFLLIKVDKQKKWSTHISNVYTEEFVLCFFTY